jgi:hypothetical protein
MTGKFVLKVGFILQNGWGFSKTCKRWNRYPVFFSGFGVPLKMKIQDGVVVPGFVRLDGHADGAVFAQADLAVPE